MNGERVVSPTELMKRLRDKSTRLMRSNRCGEATIALRLRLKLVDHYLGPASHESAGARLDLCIAVRVNGDKARAVSLAEEALAMYKPLLEADPENPRLQMEEGIVRGLLGL